MTTTPDAAKWLALLAPPDAPVCAVGILDEPPDPRLKTFQTWTTAARLAPIAKKWQAEGRSIYAAIHGFDVNALPLKPDGTAPWSEVSRQREPRAARPAHAVKTIRCLPIDVDKPEADFLGKLASAVEAGFPRPTCVVETSPGKFQALWVLAEHKPAQEWESWYTAATAALCERFKGDKQVVGDLARVLRLPGYRNLKKNYPDRPVSELREIDLSRRYSVEELSAALGVPDRPMAPPRVPAQTAAGSGEWTEADKECRRKEWPAVLAKLPPLEFNVGESQAAMKRAVMTAGDWGWTEDEVAWALGPWLADAKVHPAERPNPDEQDRAAFAARLYRNVFPSRENPLGVRLLEHRHAQAVDAWDWGEAPAMTTDKPAAKAETAPPTLGSLIGPNLERLRRRAEGKEKPVPLPWPTLAKQLGGGLWPGLHMLVGNTGTGKSQLALRVALSAARAGVPVLYVALELGEVDMVARLLTMDTSTPWSRLFLGENLHDVEAAEKAAPALAELPFHMEFGPPGGWSSLRLAPAVKAIRETRTDRARPVLVVVDYLQIIGDPQPRGRTLELRERIGRAAYDARQVAREQDAAVLMISSTARENYKTLATADAAAFAPDGKVTAPDALVGLGKESGEIEYAADTVSVAVRWPDPLPPGDEHAQEAATSILVATPKVRAGRPAWTELRFNGWHFTEPVNPRILQDAMVANAKKGTKKASGNDTGDGARGTTRIRDTSE